MYHPEYGKALDKLISIHRRYRETIHPAVQDVRLAIYYLTGGVITQAKFALRAWSSGDLNTPFRAKRFIDEAHLLVQGLIVVPDRERFVRRFFQDEIVEIDPLKYKEAFMKGTGMDESTFETWVDVKKQINHGFSKGVHVTYKSVGYNSDIDTAEFDYDATGSAYQNIDGFDFATFVIIPTIDTVVTPSAAFGLSKDDLQDVYDQRETIQEIAFKYHETHKGRKIDRSTGKFETGSLNVTAPTTDQSTPAPQTEDASSEPSERSEAVPQDVPGSPGLP